MKNSPLTFSKRTKIILAVLIIGIVIGVIAITGTAYIMHSTSDTKFCVSCHSMQKPLAEYQSGIHYSNEHGVRAECADCHIPSKPIDYLVMKVAAVKDIYHEIAGTIDTDKKYEERRLKMAKTVWEFMEKTDSATCRSCHNFNAMTLLDQSNSARKMHTKAMSTHETCIACHKGIAHLLPDSSDSTQDGVNALAKIAQASSPSAKVLFSIATQPFYLDKKDKHNQGNLMPSTKLTVLNRSDDRVQGSLLGWQQEGVESIIYAARGKRIISALLDKKSQKELQVLNTQKDEDTGLTWSKVRLDVWVNTDKMIDSITPLWSYSSNLMDANCTGCHGRTALDHYNANQWIGVIKAMQNRTSLTLEQSRILTQYVQKHANDMPGSEK